MREAECGTYVSHRQPKGSEFVYCSALFPCGVLPNLGLLLS